MTVTGRGPHPTFPNKTHEKKQIQITERESLQENSLIDGSLFTLCFYFSLKLVSRIKLKSIESKSGGQRLAINNLIKCYLKFKQYTN